jgi:hypothetical protein
MRFLPSDMIVCDSLVNKIDHYLPKETTLDTSNFVEVLSATAYETMLQVAFIAAPVFIALSIAYQLLSLGIKLSISFVTLPVQIANHPVPESLKAGELFGHINKIYCLALFTFACPVAVLHSSKAGVQVYNIIMGKEPPLPIKDTKEKKVITQDSATPKGDNLVETGSISGPYLMVISPPDDKMPPAPPPTPTLSSPPPIPALPSKFASFLPSALSSLLSPPTPPPPPLRSSLPIQTSPSASPALGTSNPTATTPSRGALLADITNRTPTLRKVDQGSSSQSKEGSPGTPPDKENEKDNSGFMSIMRKAFTPYREKLAGKAGEETPDEDFE